MRDRPDLAALMSQSVAAFKAMSPEDQKKLRAAQRKSWVIGEMMLARPEISRELAERLYYEVAEKE